MIGDILYAADSDNGPWVDSVEEAKEYMNDDQTLVSKGEVRLIELVPASTAEYMLEQILDCMYGEFVEEITDEIEKQFFKLDKTKLEKVIRDEIARQLPDFKPTYIHLLTEVEL